MKFKSVTALCVFAICLIGAMGERVVVQVEQGQLSGEVLQTAFGNRSYISFKGIPYAKPPVGDLRFKDPQPPVAWDGIRNATEHGARCPQVNMFANVYQPGSEDCLFLNVYTPNISNKTLPVLVFIHGGVFKFLSGNVDFFSPDFFLNTTDEMVIVTLNYRLDALGQLSLNNSDVPGNAGLKDQVYALRWVQKNIKKFGGDPKQVTLMGNSAGAVSVSYHILSPMSKGLFHRAMIQSGVSLCDWGQSYYPVDRAYALAQDNGFTTKNSTELLSFLQNITYDKLINTTSTVLASELSTEYFIKLIPFAPVVEHDFGQEIFMSKTPYEALKAGKVNVDNVIIGYNDRESITFMPFTEVFMTGYSRYPEMFVPTKVLDHAYPKTVLDLSKKIVNYFYGDKNVSLANINEFSDFLGNFSFAYDTYRYANLLLENNVSVYSYKFGVFTEWNYFSTSLGSPYNLTGAAHMDEVLYMFYATSLQQSFAVDSDAPRLINLITTLWSNFVRFGVPTPNKSLGFQWPKYNNASRLYLNAKNNFTIGSRADEKAIAFAKEVLETAGVAFI